MDAQTIKDKLLETFADAEIKLSDMTGGGDHWNLEIRSKSFEGKSLVQQHQAVYKALGPWMKKEIHALALKTSTK